MEPSELLYIEDEEHRRLYYYFSPPLFISNFVPLMVVLTEPKKAEELHSSYKMWHVLTPVLEGDEVWEKELLHTLIQQYADEYECEDDIYLYGEGPAGYTALEKGIDCGADAVFSQSPLERKEGMLAQLLHRRKSLPIFYVCNREQDEAVSAFVERCRQQKIRVHTDFCPSDEEGELRLIQEVMNMFEHVPAEYTP